MMVLLYLYLLVRKSQKKLMIMEINIWFPPRLVLAHFKLPRPREERGTFFGTPPTPSRQHRMLHTVFAFESREQRQLARNIALAQGIRNTQPGGATRSPDGSSCACGERASLLHAPSTMKLWPWVQKLFRFHRPSFLPPVDDAALFRSRSEQSRDIGGGFWGSEDSKDLESMNHGTLRWAMDRGLSVITGNCCTMATSLGNYARGEFPKQKMEDTAATSAASRTLRVKVETNAAVDAYIFIGEIFPISHALQSLGLEFVIDAMGKRSMMRWGMQGEEIASYEGRLLTGQWSKFWVSQLWFRGGR